MVTQIPVFAQQGEDDSRRTEIVVSITEHKWWLTRWQDNEIVCVIGTETENLPTDYDILLNCGEEIYGDWAETKPCEAAAELGDTSTCSGLYFIPVDQQVVEKELVVDLPTPTIWLSMIDCKPQPPLNHCINLPTLVLEAEEPLPNESITAIHVVMGEKEVTCEKNRCEFPLEPTSVEGDFIEFWADSTFGDESKHFTARLRIIDAGVSEATGYGNWFVDIISSQWRGESFSSCAAMWEAFPPVGGVPQWLSSPSDHTGLASNTPFVFLAAELIRRGVVDASGCAVNGLLRNGAASPCGVQQARSIVNDWQDQFDQTIFEVAQDKSIPAQLFKNLFAQESQFWPGKTVEKEFGLGQLTALGADTTLLWNIEFYEQFCPLVLHEETCSKGYAFIGDEAQELLRGAFAANANALCPECATGVDLAHAQTTIEYFGETIIANCSQVAFIVSDVTDKQPGEVASYEDLWRHTLASYNVGPYCLAKAVNTAWSRNRSLEWEVVASKFTPGCANAKEYVSRVTSDRLFSDAYFLSPLDPTTTPITTGQPTRVPSPTPVGPTAVPPSSTPVTPTSTPVGYPAPPTATQSGNPPPATSTPGAYP